MANLSRRGMTLLELSVAILILGIIAAVATPRFADAVEQRQVRDAAIRLADEIHYIRSVAVNEGRSTTLALDPAATRFSSPDVDDARRQGNRLSVSLADSYVASVSLDATFDTSKSLTFDRQGTPSIDGTPVTSGHVIVAGNQSGYAIAIGDGADFALISPRTLLQISAMRQGAN